jgi:hypothetical protein
LTVQQGQGNEDIGSGHHAHTFAEQCPFDAGGFCRRRNEHRILPLKVPEVINAAKIPMMAITTNNSTSVKAFWRLKDFIIWFWQLENYFPFSKFVQSRIAL